MRDLVISQDFVDIIYAVIAKIVKTQPKETLPIPEIPGPDADGNEEYYSLHAQSKDRWVGNVITTYAFDNSDDIKTSAQAKTIIQRWLKEGLIQEVDYMSAKQRKERKGVQSAGRVGEQK